MIFVLVNEVSSAVLIANRSGRVSDMISFQINDAELIAIGYSGRRCPGRQFRNIPHEACCVNWRNICGLTYVRRDRSPSE